MNKWEVPVILTIDQSLRVRNVYKFLVLMQNTTVQKPKQIWRIYIKKKQHLCKRIQQWAWLSSLCCPRMTGKVNMVNEAGIQCTTLVFVNSILRMLNQNYIRLMIFPVVEVKHRKMCSSVQIKQMEAYIQSWCLDLVSEYDQAFYKGISLNLILP